MKRKSIAVPGRALFAGHVIAFISLTLLIVYSLIATLTYPGNAEVPFAVFRPFIIERLGWILLLGGLLLGHYAARQVGHRAAYYHQRARISRYARLDAAQRRLAAMDAEAAPPDAGEEDSAARRRQG